ncbi:MAG: hypothetical protein K0R38_6712 [Polyangiaceae bacterium]|jgi:hypothetical protein|nr:hypothetical protein [Polyangiaceae bacterium]
MNPFGFWAPSPAFALHKVALGIGFVLWFLGILAGELILLGIGGIAITVSGIAAILGGRSVLHGVSIGGAHKSWTEEEIATMAPGARVRHAITTGAVLILMGGIALTFVVYGTYRHWLTVRSVQLERERGTDKWSPYFSDHFGMSSYGWYDGLAIGGGRICHSAHNVDTHDKELDCTLPAGPSLSLGREHVARRLRLSDERLLWASDFSIGFVALDRGALKSGPQQRIAGLPRAIAGASDWLAWDEGAALVVWDVSSAQIRRFENSLPAQGRVVLAALGERLGFGPAKGCAFRALEPHTGEQECVVGGSSLPVAADWQRGVAFLALEDGKLLELKGSQSKRWGRLQSPLAVSAVDGALFVVTREGVYRLPAPGADAEPLFLHSVTECDAAGAFGELFAWQFGRDVRVIKRAAQPLEDFELP